MNTDQKIVMIDIMPNSSDFVSMLVRKTFSFTTSKCDFRIALQKSMNLSNSFIQLKYFLGTTLMHLSHTCKQLFKLWKLTKIAKGAAFFGIDSLRLFRAPPHLSFAL